MDAVLKKEVEKDVLEEIAGTAKDVLYERLEPYGFKCDWMDDYLTKKDEAAKAVKAVFERRMSSMETDVTDLFKVSTELGILSEKMPGFSAWTAVYTDYTEFAKNYETMYGFKKAEGTPQVKEIKAQEETNPAPKEPDTEPVPNEPADSQEKPAETETTESTDNNDGIESENVTDTIDDTNSTGNTDGTDDVYFKDKIKIPDMIFKY